MILEVFILDPKNAAKHTQAVLYLGATLCQDMTSIRSILKILCLSVPDEGKKRRMLQERPAAHVSYSLNSFKGVI